MKEEKIIKMFAEKGLLMSHGRFKTEKHIYEIVRNESRDWVKMTFIDNIDKKTGEVKFPIIIKFYVDLQSRLFHEHRKAKTPIVVKVIKSQKIICSYCRSFKAISQITFRRSNDTIYYKKACDMCITVNGLIINSEVKDDTSHPNE